MINYSKKVLKHFSQPHNVGKIAKADGVGQVGNLVCGDVMRLYIKVGKNEEGKEIIKDIKFETYGCAAAIATSSVITDLVKGRELEEVIKMESGDVLEELGGLPPVKIHCSLLSVDALGEAIFDYYKKKKRKVPAVLKKRHEKVVKLRGSK